ncbi:hypothetical protein [Vibrio aphrogenes]|uniref:hypothetical protein n=1 Tax=Vibrio aphrogenes TaxID=1891186 RepID=UPI000B363819|nr:hypothetical protein [Vibrio aphrogenes]
MALDNNGNFAKIEGEEIELNELEADSSSYYRSFISIHDEYIHIYTVETESDCSNLIVPNEDNTFYFNLLTISLGDDELSYIEDGLYIDSYYENLKDKFINASQIYVNANNGFIYKLDSGNFNNERQVIVDLNLIVLEILDEISVLNEGALSSDERENLFLNSEVDIFDNSNVNNFKFYYNKVRNTLATGESELLEIP